MNPLVSLQSFKKPPLSDHRIVPVSIGGKIGEWAQGINRMGEPVIYSLTVTPFQIRRVVERSDALSVIIHPETLEEPAKTRRAILALAEAYGFMRDCKYRI